ncbi:hypothetical protein QN239_32430 [Mycolicibacterium sp. Y3]
MIAKAARCLTVGAVALVVVTGCTRVVDGIAARAPGGPAPGAVDPALLVPGNYPTKPQNALGTAGSPERGARVEGARMAGAVVGPWEVDPKLSVGVLPTGILTSARQLKALTTSADAAGRHQFITAFVSTRRNNDNTLSMVTGLLRFADPASAAQAVTDMHDTSLVPPAPDSFGVQRTAAPVPAHPESLATAATGPSAAGDPRLAGDVEVLTARGPFVLYVWAKSLDGIDAAMALATDGLEKQIPRADSFVPTDVAGLSELAVDPTGLLARTLPAPPDDTPGLPSNLTFDEAGSLHFQTDPAATSALFDKAGMQVWASGKTGVYQTRDAAAAVEVANAFAAEMRDGGSVEAGVPNLKGSQCSKKQQLTVVLYNCYSTADKYVIEASSPQLADAQQQSAAQYLMLTAQ